MKATETAVSPTPAKKQTPKSLLDEFEVMPREAFARLLGKTSKTVRRMELAETAPARIVISRETFYSRSAIRRWLEEREQQSVQTPRDRRIRRNGAR